MHNAGIKASQSNRVSRHRAWRFASMVLIFTLIVAPAVHAADDYLDALEAEAGDTGRLNKNPKKNVKSGGAKNDIKAKFEKLLEFELPSTYKFYIKLSPQDQDKVVKIYMQEKKMSTASKAIFDMYFESNK